MDSSIGPAGESGMRALAGWQELVDNRAAVSGRHLRELFAADPERYSWGPSQDLIDYVKANTDTADLYGDEPELIEACTSDEAVAENLTFRFMPGDQIMFVLSGFPHVSSVCNGDLFAVPALEISGFLHASAENLLPSLAD